MATSRSSNRKEEILQALAHMLEQNHGGTITTAALAKQVGVSEAALYRHFSSKTKMLEALIEFIEETIFSRINLILADVTDVNERLQQLLQLLLAFAEKNPGISRFLQGDILMGESDTLRQRMSQFFARLDTQFKQVLREGEARGFTPVAPAEETAALLLAIAEGRIGQYVRSGFQQRPTKGWPQQWQILQQGLFS